MDALVELLPLLFIGAYYLLAGRRRAKRKQAAREQAQPAGPAEQRAATPFQNFLEQLEEAMSEASGEPAAEVVSTPAQTLDSVPAVEPVPAAEPIPESRLESMEFNAPSGSFDSATPVDHQAHGFGVENPLSEETFEQRPAYAQTAIREPARYDPHGLRPSAAVSSQNVWNKRLGDPKAAQDAFVLQTVFGARGGRRPKR